MVNGLGLSGPAEERQDDAGGDSSHGNEEEMTKRFAPGTEKTAGRHGNRPDSERHRSRHSQGGLNTHGLVANGKEEVDEPETKERDVPQSRQTTTKAVVSAHPVLAMKEQADQCPGDHSE